PPERHPPRPRALLRGARPPRPHAGDLVRVKTIEEDPMAQMQAGFPFWELEFKEDGGEKDPAAIDAFVAEAAAQGLTDLFVFSHGWNNDRPTAELLYKGFFGAMRKLVDDPALPKKRAAKIGTAGVLWPSILWPDEKAALESGQGGAAALGGGGEGGDLAAELKKVWSAPGQGETVDELVAMLDEQPRDEAALKEFKRKLNGL